MTKREPNTAGEQREAIIRSVSPYIAMLADEIERLLQPYGDGIGDDTIRFLCREIASELGAQVQWRRRLRPTRARPRCDARCLIVRQRPANSGAPGTAKQDRMAARRPGPARVGTSGRCARPLTLVGSN
jgi:hypothetical protein